MWQDHSFPYRTGNRPHLAVFDCPVRKVLEGTVVASLDLHHLQAQLINPFMYSQQQPYTFLANTLVLCVPEQPPWAACISVRR